VKIRNYRLEDEEALIALKGAAFDSGHERFTGAFWRWQYHETPAGAGIGVVALENDAVVGFAGGLPKRIKVGDRTVRCAQVVDYMVDPAIKGGYLGVLLLRKLNELAKREGFSLSVGLPNPNADRVATSKKGGMRDVLSPVIMAKPVRPFPVTGDLGGNKILQIGLGVAMGVEIVLSRAFRRVGSSPPGVVIDEVRTADEHFDDLWERASENLPVAFVRDAAYVEWRFLRHPVYRYGLFLAQDGRGPLGYLVVLVRAMNGIRVGEIVDWLIRPDAPEACGWLLNTALDWARAAGVHVAVAAALAGMPGYRALRRAGWYGVPPRLDPTNFNLVAQVFEDGLDAHLFEKRNWYWTLGDADVA
jgi:GNAT superfamily N-acetyltransferase